VLRGAFAYIDITAHADSLLAWQVASYFSQFGIEGESINFDSFKTGVRTGRKTEEKSQRDKTKQMLADRRKQEAATALVAKKAAKAAKVKVDEA
jgi:hypothetical protein